MLIRGSSIFDEIQRKEKRTPMEMALCMFWGIPSHFLRDIRRRYQIEPIGDIARWFDVEMHRYQVIGSWLFNWNLGLEVPSEILTNTDIHYYPDAIVAQKSLEMVRALYPLSDKCQQQCPGNNEWIPLWVRAMLSDFCLKVADSGVGYALGLPNYPSALGIGKVAEYEKAIVARRGLEFRKGRPPQSVSTSYPAEATLFNWVCLRAKEVAAKEKRFRKGEYQAFLDSKTWADSLGKKNPQLQVGSINYRGELVVTSQGSQHKKATTGKQHNRSQKK
jgi:hypothetical protein